MKSWAEKIILDTLFPIKCLSCQKEGQWLCKKCFSQIKIKEEQICPLCEKAITPRGKVCQNCKSKNYTKGNDVPIDSLLTSTSYSDRLVSRLVHLLKYNFIPDLFLPLGKIIESAFKKNDCSIPDLIIPVPLHSRRLRWRGFNQSELLADFLGKNISPAFPIPVEKGIIFRQKHVSPQMKIANYQERKRNISGIFSIRKDKFGLIKDRDILLVDDIATTGATLFEIGHILKKNGAKKVYGVVVARQEIK